MSRWLKTASVNEDLKNIYNKCENIVKPYVEAYKQDSTNQKIIKSLSVGIHALTVIIEDFDKTRNSIIQLRENVMKIYNSKADKK